MSAKSKHLERKMTFDKGATELQVVFVDIEKYSQRVASNQRLVIDSFARCLDRALTETSKNYSDYFRGNQLTKADIVTIPTGDGAAIGFSFDGLRDIHLFFAKRLLEEIYKSNKSTKCDEFSIKGWCDIHPTFYIRVGISEGTGIIYKDIKDGYNIAGDVINMASRVMDVADRNQIIFTEEAYKKLIGLYPNLKNRFEKRTNVKIKRAIVDVYQYKGENKEKRYISNDLPLEVTDYGLLTQADLKNALLHIDDGLENLNRSIAGSSGSLALEGVNNIYGMVAERIKMAQNTISIVRLGTRPKAEDYVIQAIADRILSDRKVEYEIVVVLNPEEPLGGFVRSHNDLLKLLKKGRQGTHPSYHPKVLETKEPICFDTFIVDRKEVGIGFTRSGGAPDMQHAILFPNEYMANNFAAWFRHIIVPKAVDFDEWFKEWKKKDMKRPKSKLIPKRKK